MKTRRHKLTITLPDVGSLVRGTRAGVRGAYLRLRGWRLPSLPYPMRLFRSRGSAEIAESSVDLELVGHEAAFAPAIQEPRQLRPLRLSATRGRVLAIALSPITLDDYRHAGQFGRLQRALERYSSTFDKVYVLSPDAGDHTERLGVARTAHLGMPRWTPARRYVSLVLLPFFHRRRLAGVTVVRALNAPAGVTGAIIRRFSGGRVFVARGLARPEPEFESSWPRGRIDTLIENRGLKSADELIASTSALQENLSELYPDKPVRLLPDFIDTDMFCPARVTDPSAAPLLLFTGAIERHKNLPLLFDALELACPAVPALRLAVIGHGSLRPELEANARGRGLPVDFTGNVPHESLPSLMSRALAFVLPSDHETTPTALLEAMSSGTPCIATDVPGIRGVITHGLNGLLAPSGDAGAIAKAIVRLRREPVLRTRLGLEARRFVVSRYSFDASMASEIDVLLGRAVADSPSFSVAPRRMERAA